MPAIAQAHGDGPAAGLTTAHDGDIRDLVSLGVANAGGQGGVSLDEVGAEPLGTKGIYDGDGRRYDVVDYWKYTYVARRQPRRQCPVVDLQQVGDHAFH